MSLRAFLSRRIVTPEGVRPGAVLVDGDRIQDVVAVAQLPAGCAIEDFKDSAILPGLVDSHIHINDPGRADWEGFDTATRAAAAGGYTLLVDMPLNCLPGTNSVSALEAKRAAARDRCWVDWQAWGGVVADNAEHIEALGAAGVAGFKCFLVHPGVDGFSMVTEEQLRAALPHVARTGLPLLVHAELQGPIDEATASLPEGKWKAYRTYLLSRPDAAELAAIRLLLELCREYKFRLHIVHLATAAALPMLHSARAAGLPVTVETCPHYLHLTAENISDGATLFKCAPPIRSGQNREQLWTALRDGTIDLVATDHSPCPPALKQLEQGDFRYAWGGIASVSVALPVMFTEATARGCELTEIAKWMGEAPAKLAGSRRKGRISAGYDADFCVFDTESHFVVTEDRLHFRHPVSPYLGERLRGIVKATYLRGEPVYANGQFCGKPRGRTCARD